MCAGKLLSLIKKCLHRDKAGGHKCDCNGNAASGTSASTCTSSTAAAASGAMATRVSEHRQQHGSGAALGGAVATPHHHHHHGPALTAAPHGLHHQQHGAAPPAKGKKATSSVPLCCCGGSTGSSSYCPGCVAHPAPCCLQGHTTTPAPGASLAHPPHGPCSLGTGGAAASSRLWPSSSGAYPSGTTATGASPTPHHEHHCHCHHHHSYHHYPPHGQGAVGAASHCCSVPCTNSVVYVPTTPLDRLEREVALQRERQQRHQAIQMDMELNLPPAIHISEDGEEGYAQSQRLLLQLSCQQRAGEAIRPPPNKTVLPPGDSPPPFRSNSVGKIEGSAYNYRRPTVSVHGNSVATVPNQYHGNNNHHNHHHHPQHHQSFPPALLPTSTKPQPQVYVGGTGAGGSPFIPRCHSVCSGDKRPVVMVAPPSVSVSQVQHNTTGRQANTSAVSDTLNTTTAAAVQQPGAPVSATTACCEPANSPSPSPPTGNT